MNEKIEYVSVESTEYSADLTADTASFCAPKARFKQLRKMANKQLRISQTVKTIKTIKPNCFCLAEPLPLTPKKQQKIKIGLLFRSKKLVIK